MKGFNLFIGISLLVRLVCACQPATFSDEDRKNAISEVRHTLDNYCQDIRASGMTAEFKYLDPSPDLCWVPPGSSSALNYDSVWDAIDRNARSLKSVDNRFDALAVFPLSRDHAAYAGKTAFNHSGHFRKISSTFYMPEIRCIDQTSRRLENHREDTPQL